MCAITFFLLFLHLALVGCADTQVVSALQKDLDSLGLTTRQVRLSNLDRVRRFSTTIESAADSIAASETDPEIRENALLWKISGIPAFRQALLFPDPGVATVDAWVLSIQTRQFFTTGSGNQLFGSSQDIAVRAISSIEQDFEYRGKELYKAGRYDELSSKAEQWALKHPIADRFYNRPSVVTSLKEFEFEVGSGMGGAVGNIAQDVHDISTRLNLYAAQLPGEARWQAEYLLARAGLEEKFGAVEMDVAAVADAVNRLTILAERGKLVIDIKALQALEEDVRRLEATISTERAVVLEDVNRQRLETIAKIDAIAQREMRQVSDGAIALIDHLVWRVVQVAGGCAVVVGCFVLLYRFSARRRTTV